MTYEYICDKCKNRWDEVHPMKDRNLPVGKQSPCCEDGVVKMAITAPGLNFDGAISPIRRAGTGWNDVLKGIKKASGKDNTIEHY